tara:strand:+ start:6543 stop:6908 length:366 start_codon:yes stop_codon:yes gene_type:complete
VKTEIYTDYAICLDNSENIIKEYSNYAEMIIHLFQLHAENPKADYFVKWYKYEKTLYTKEDARKGGYCIEGEEEEWDSDPTKPFPYFGDYPRLYDEIVELDRGSYELDILGKYQIKEEVEV